MDPTYDSRNWKRLAVKSSVGNLEKADFCLDGNHGKLC